MPDNKRLTWGDNPGLEAKVKEIVESNTIPNRNDLTLEITEAFICDIPKSLDLKEGQVVLVGLKIQSIKPKPDDNSDTN